MNLTKSLNVRYVIIK